MNKNLLTENLRIKWLTGEFFYHLKKGFCVLEQQ